MPFENYLHTALFSRSLAHSSSVGFRVSLLSLIYQCRVIGWTFDAVDQFTPQFSVTAEVGVELFVNLRKAKKVCYWTE